MKRILISLCMLAMTLFTLQAQNEKLRVAVFDPTSSGTSIDEGTKVAVREIISSTFVNTGKYSIVERSLLQQVMREQAFSNTDVVDESQATELGRLAGANKVVLSVVTLVGGRNMLSVKTIDVKTATVEQQKAKLVSSNDLLDTVEPLTLELLGEQVNWTTIATSPQPQSQTQQNMAVAPNNTPHTNTSKTNEGYATLYIYRPNNFVGSALKWPVYLDGTLITSISNNSKIIVKPDKLGEVKVHYHQGIGIILILKHGNEYYIRLGLQGIELRDEGIGRVEYDRVKNQLIK